MIRALALAAALAGPVSASPWVVEPPAEYRNCRPPAGYVVQERPLEEVNNICHILLGRRVDGPGDVYGGCYVAELNTTFIQRKARSSGPGRRPSGGVPPGAWSALKRHEDAHACGWRHD